jgi:2-isopropylmalate synthase
MHLLQATYGRLVLSTTTVKLIALEGEDKITCSVGTGSVDTA